MTHIDLMPPEGDVKCSPEIQRTAAAFHEAGHAVMAMAIGGVVVGVGIDASQCCEFQLLIPKDDADERERARLLVGLAGWRAAGSAAVRMRLR